MAPRYAGFAARLLDDGIVVIERDGRRVAEARWDGQEVIDCRPPLEGSSADIDRVRAELGAQIEAETVAAYQALPPACDEQGVDVTLMDWMLSLSADQRLAVLQDAADALDRDVHGDALP